MPAHILTALVLILMLVVVFSALFWPNEPLSDRSDLDEACNYYFKVLATKGELTSQQEAALRSRLEAELFDNISILIVEGGGYGSEVKLAVDVEKTYQVQNGLNQEDKTMELHYEQTTLCTKLEATP